jgi:hypothetical protein
LEEKTTENDKFLFEFPALRVLKNVPRLSSDVILGNFHSFGFNVTVRPKLNTAPFTFGDIVVGALVGKFERGGDSPT